MGAVLLTASFAGATESRGRGVAAAVALLGYACRLSQWRSSPDSEVAEITAALAFTDAGELDYALLADEPARIGALLDRTAALAASERHTAALAGCGVVAWTTFSSSATHHLVKTFVRHGLKSDELPLADEFPRLLRLGYAIRVVDEIAGERPASRRSVKEALEDRARLRDGSDTDSWRRDAAALCLESFDPLVERLLEIAVQRSLALDVGGEPSHEQVDEGIASARFGYAVRWCEHRNDLGSPSGPEAEWLRTLVPTVAGIVESLLDVVRYGYHGGPDALLHGMPGALPEARATVLGLSSPVHTARGRTTAPGLAIQGYLLCRVIEVRPDWSDVLSRSPANGGPRVGH